MECRVVQDFSRLTWVKAMVGEVIQDGLHCSCRFNNSRPKSSFGVIRFYNDNDGRPISRFNNTRERKRAAPADGTHKHLQNGSALKEAVASLIDSVYQGTALDSKNYVDVLQGCFKQRDLESVKQVHECIKKSGLEQNPYVASTLLKCYIGCGRLQNAQELFDRLLDKNIVSWTIMIGGYAQHDQAGDAIELYEQLREEGGQPNSVTYVTVLKACTGPLALKWGRSIHAHTIRDGFQTDVLVCNALVNMYAKCGSIEDARSVFDEMKRRDLISWNAMIGGLAQNGHGQEAFSLFLDMQREGFAPNAATYICILSARVGPKDLAWVKEVHSHVTTSRLAQDASVNNALILMYLKCDNVDDAKLVFDSMMNRSNVISWNAIISGLARTGRGLEAMSCFHQMQREGVVPDAATCLSILNSNACEGAMGWVKEVHEHATISGLIADLRVGNALVHMYAKSGSIETARTVFDKMKSRNVKSWTAMIGGLAEHGLGHEAYSLFLQMLREGFVPDSITYMSILHPCSSTGALEWVKEVHAHAMKANLHVDLRVGSALVHMYAKIGNIAAARQVFDELSDRDVVCWTSMIGALAQHGHGREALQLFNEMTLKGVNPNQHMFVAILSACSHAGLVDEGRFQFVSMSQNYCVEPTMEHYNCIVDLLGRAGHLEEAKRFVFNMPIKPDRVTWKALLGACRIFNSTRQANIAAKECLEMEPMDPAPYVLLSNTYAADGNWDEALFTRGLMQERGVRKDPGLCWIRVGNKVHYFVARDTSHPEAREIYALLNSLYKEMEAEGYIPDTRLVMRNIHEEEKETALCSHSEKLAIAYGLMHVTPGEPILIYKNLRICKDCHTVSKLVSKITKREVVARDANRFHHFRDGLCSCGDYW